MSVFLLSLVYFRRMLSVRVVACIFYPGYRPDVIIDSSAARTLLCHLSSGMSGSSGK